MDLHKLGQLSENIGGIKPSSSPSISPAGLKDGPGFADTLKKITDQNSVGGIQPQVGAEKALVFSKHAVERMQTRGIGMNPGRMERLDTAFTKAAEKGSKNTLVLMDDSAFIMSVKNKTIVTAMDKATLKENLFTNIDSTIIV